MAAALLFNIKLSTAANICPAQGSVTGDAADVLTTGSIETSSFTGPVELHSGIKFNIYHKVVNDEELHIILESQDTTNRWLGFGFAEQQSGHMKGKVIYLGICVNKY